MTEALLLKVVDVALFAFEMGVARKDISEAVAKNPPEKIPAILAQMATDALDKLDQITK
jgi:hypothetical protein